MVPAASARADSREMSRSVLGPSDVLARSIRASLVRGRRGDGVGDRRSFPALLRWGGPPLGDLHRLRADPGRVRGRAELLIVCVSAGMPPARFVLPQPRSGAHRLPDRCRGDIQPHLPDGAALPDLDGAPRVAERGVAPAQSAHRNRYPRGAVRLPDAETGVDSERHAWARSAAPLCVPS